MSNIEINNQELKDLKRVRDYFGAHDKTQLEHFCFQFTDDLIRKVEYSDKNKAIEPAINEKEVTPSKALEDYEFNLKKHWSNDETEEGIKHFRD